MTRPTYIEINTSALRHNIAQIKQRCAPKQVIAMVKANAYGCGIVNVVPVLAPSVDYFGVSCLEEALQVRALTDRACILFEGIFSAQELLQVAQYRLECVIHHEQQLEWLLNTPLSEPIKVWVKVNTGMNRLGFEPAASNAVVAQLARCAWVSPVIGLITHLASADEPGNEQNEQQITTFYALECLNAVSIRSVSNSAALYSGINLAEEVVRPGILLYGISPFSGKNGSKLGLKPVMRFYSAVIAIQMCPIGARVGYGGTWQSQRLSRIGVVAVGYGDGYPRHIRQNTPTWINGCIAPIVGRVSMDMLTVNLTDCPGVRLGDRVELWGDNVPIEIIARSADTIAYELICQMTPRALRRTS